jgi:sugar-specific transcriptional regulator TrmB/DNA-binding CsgD family transcriptional regulator
MSRIGQGPDQTAYTPRVKPEPEASDDPLALPDARRTTDATPRAALGVLGLSATEERVYRHVLSARAGSARVVARVLRLPIAEVEHVLARLTAMGLVRGLRTEVPAYVTGQGVQPSGVREVRYLPEPPAPTLGALIEARAADLVSAGATVERLAELYERSVERDDRARPAEVVEGVDAVSRVVHDLLTTTGVELLNLDRQPFVRADAAGTLPAAMLDLMARGVEVRTIYASDAYRVAGYAEYMQQAAAAGERARMLGHLPLRFVVADRGTAVLPLAADGPWASAALVVRGPVLVADLVQTFEDLWEQAVVTDDPGAVSRDEEFTEQDVALLRMLAHDLTDVAIGRHLGTSERTVGRRVSGLQRRLGAGTRFAMGAEAARRGLV